MCCGIVCCGVLWFDDRTVFGRCFPLAFVLATMPTAHIQPLCFARFRAYHTLPLSPYPPPPTHTLPPSPSQVHHR